MDNETDSWDAISRLLNFNMGSISNIGLDASVFFRKSSTPDSYWQLGTSVTSNTPCKFVPYFTSDMDLDGNSNPLEGMLATQILTKE